MRLPMLGKTHSIESTANRVSEGAPGFIAPKYPESHRKLNPIRELLADFRDQNRNGSL